MLIGRLQSNETVAGNDYRIVITLSEGGEDYSPSSATYKIQDPLKQYVDGAEGTFVVEGNKLEAVVPGSKLPDVGNNYRMQIILYKGVVSVYLVRYFDVLEAMTVIDVTSAELSKYPGLRADEDYCNVIGIALNEVDMDLKGRGVDLNIVPVRESRMAVIHKARMLLYQDKSSKADDKFAIHYGEAANRYSEVLDHIVFGTANRKAPKKMITYEL